MSSNGSKGATLELVCGVQILTKFEHGGGRSRFVITFYCPDRLTGNEDKQCYLLMRKLGWAQLGKLGWAMRKRRQAEDGLSRAWQASEIHPPRFPLILSCHPPLVPGTPLEARVRVPLPATSAPIFSTTFLSPREAFSALRIIRSAVLIRARRNTVGVPFRARRNTVRLYFPWHFQRGKEPGCGQRSGLYGRQFYEVKPRIRARRNTVEQGDGIRSNYTVATPNHAFTRVF